MRTRRIGFVFISVPSNNFGRGNITHGKMSPPPARFPLMRAEHFDETRICARLDSPSNSGLDLSSRQINEINLSAPGRSVAGL